MTGVHGMPPSTISSQISLQKSNTETRLADLGITNRPDFIGNVIMILVSVTTIKGES